LFSFPRFVFFRVPLFPPRSRYASCFSFFHVFVIFGLGGGFLVRYLIALVPILFLLLFFCRGVKPFQSLTFFFRGADLVFCFPLLHPLLFSLSLFRIRLLHAVAVGFHFNLVGLTFLFLFLLPLSITFSSLGFRSSLRITLPIVNFHLVLVPHPFLTSEWPWCDFYGHVPGRPRTFFD